MRMCSTLALISCNAALREGGKGVGGEICGEEIRHTREDGRRRERGKALSSK